MSYKLGERKIIKFVHQGHLVIHGDGTIWQLRYFNGFHKKWCDIKKKRIDKIKPRYSQISFQYNRVRHCCMSHRLVWQYYEGDIPPGRQINHIDCDTHNNRISNLELVTPKQNRKHADDNNRIIPFLHKGSQCSWAKLNERDVIAIRHLCKIGKVTFHDLATAFGVTTATINNIVNHKSWKHVTDDWLEIQRGDSE